MRTRRLTGLSLGVLAAVALALTGCADDSATPGAAASGAPTPATSSAAADPAAASQLASAAAALGNTSFKLTMTNGPGVNVTAQVDPVGSKGPGALTLSGPNATLELKTLLVGEDLYAQIPGITKAGTWTHLDMAKLPEGVNIGLRPGQIDPANTAQLLTSTTDVRQVGSRNYEGTLDLTKAAGVAGINQALVQTWGAQAQNVPFTAGLDEQGRLSALTIQLPSVDGRPAPPLEVLYTDYGTTVDAQRPAAAQITEAPADLYTTLGG